MTEDEEVVTAVSFLERNKSTFCSFFSLACFLCVNGELSTFFVCKRGVSGLVLWVKCRRTFCYGIRS